MTQWESSANDEFLCGKADENLTAEDAKDAEKGKFGRRCTQIHCRITYQGNSDNKFDQRFSASISGKWFLRVSAVKRSSPTQP
jgi:hypothetical protein